ncbi:sorbitol dehydrogenase [Tetragenococcus halophilus subsp. flandriensis]|uniref:NAD(P)-dependent alcohol dehydrogenase n=1 Tax=Tetragenococcus halophilus TaxID=51669 RepID=UPI0023EA4A54|nr:NAD(P)-dependent alcohol dehydrogenase [Tetragenococcus halophilus]GMA08113.1 sorbitol dehydrogenase [Tetragenococcus halophilus subsp. flandriensis]
MVNEEKNLPTTSKSAVLQEVFDLEIKDTPIKKMKPTDVMIKIMAVGICGSDVHYYDTGRIGNFVLDGPLILGHESSGQIVAVGDEVNDFKVGDRVAIEPGVPCGRCEYCRTGRYHLCPDMQFMATPPIDGDLTQYITYPADFVYPIPDDMSYEVGTLSEPFSVSVHAAQKLDIQPGKTVFISGAGPVGLLTIFAAKAFNAGDIIISDVEESRLEMAKKLGASHTINVKEKDVKEEVSSFTDGHGVDYALEASGNNSAESDALLTLKPGGKIAYIGMPTHDTAPLDISFMTSNEPQIFGIFRYANTYPLAIKILHDNMEQANRLLTDFYSLDEVTDAFERTRTAKSDSLKVIIYPNEKLRDE